MEKERGCLEEKSGSRHQPKKGTIGQGNNGLLQRQGNRSEKAPSRGKEREQDAVIFGRLSGRTGATRQTTLCIEPLVRRKNVSSF